MSDTFRAMCEELIEELEVWIGYGDEADCADAHAVVDRARALLAEPEPEGPTDEELNTFWNCSGIADEYGNHTGNIFEFARAVLAKWGRPTPQPVVVSERLPSAADCDAEGNCWWFDPHADGAWYVDTFQSNYTHWLSTNALPNPEATND